MMKYIIVTDPNSPDDLTLHLTFAPNKATIIS